MFLLLVYVLHHRKGLVNRSTAGEESCLGLDEVNNAGLLEDIVYGVVECIVHRAGKCGSAGDTLAYD